MRNKRCDHKGLRKWYTQPPGSPAMWLAVCTRCKHERKFTSKQACTSEMAGEEIVPYPPPPLPREPWMDFFEAFEPESEAILTPEWQPVDDKRRTITMKCDCAAGTNWIAQSDSNWPQYAIVCRNCGGPPERYPKRYHNELKRYQQGGEDLRVIPFPLGTAADEQAPWNR